MAANLSTYSDCVSSLRTSLKFLESSVETLDNGVSDFPRLVNVLKTVRVSILVYIIPRTLVLTYPSITNSSPNPHSQQPNHLSATK